MKLLSAFTLSSVMLLGCTNMTTDTTTLAPVAEKIPHTMTLHGQTRVDDYYWMRDDERKDPKIIAHLNAENDYTKAQFTPYEGLKKQLFEELVARLDKDESSVPYFWHKHWYYRYYKEGFEYPVVARKTAMDNNDELVLLDVNERAAGHDFYGLGGVSVSPDESKLVFGEDLLSRRIYTLYFKDLIDGELIADKLEGTDGRVVWANDNQHVFYIAKDPQTLLGYQVFRHKLGTEQAKDVLVYEEKDDTFYIGLGKSLDESAIALYAESTITSEVLMLDANAPLTEFKAVLPREEGHEYSVSKLGDKYYILTNWQASNFRLMKVAVDKAADKQAWQEVIGNDPDSRIEDVLLLAHYMVVQTRERGISRIHVYPLKGQDFDMDAAVELEFNDPAYVVGFDINPSQQSDKLRLYYSSPTTPESVYEYDLTQPNQRKLLKQEKVLGDFDAALYQAERLFVKARDGQDVPVTLVYRKELFNKDGTNPLYQYGYGSYGYTVEPDFSTSILSLLDRGFVYSIAHVRGSEMLGRGWYDDGRMLNKQNSFNDFIDVTEALTAQGYGDKTKLLPRVAVLVVY